jgi:hypothetical protein
VRMKFALEYLLRSHNSGNSQLGILALHENHPRNAT